MRLGRRRGSAWQGIGTVPVLRSDPGCAARASGPSDTWTGSEREYWSELVNFAILGLPGNNFVKKKRKQIIGLGHREGSLAVLRAGLWAQ
ncbi:hypothetical protein EI555_012554, partial [Monodon monoceros]